MRLLKDTTWAEESPFQFFIMGVILCNAVLVGVQMNHADLEILRRLERDIGESYISYTIQ